MYFLAGYSAHNTHYVVRDSVHDTHYIVLFEFKFDPQLLGMEKTIHSFGL